MSNSRVFQLPPPVRGHELRARRRRMGRQGWRRLAVAVGFMLLGFGGWQLGAAGYIHAKAWLSQVLLSQAWADTLSVSAHGDAAGAEPRKPWPWADTGPVARLRVPELGVDQIVLAGASGRTLAFGPGHLDQTATPGAAGHSVISGHRDTHFAFLRDLAPDTKLEVQRSDGGWRSYRVKGSEVFDSRSARLSLAADRPALTLVTCWPFDAAEAGGPLRYAVFAAADEDYVPPQP
jgi:sortase A